VCVVERQGQAGTGAQSARREPQRLPRSSPKDIRSSSAMSSARDTPRSLARVYPRSSASECRRRAAGPRQRRETFLGHPFAERPCRAMFEARGDPVDRGQHGLRTAPAPRPAPSSTGHREPQGDGHQRGRDFGSLPSEKRKVYSVA